MVRSFTFSLPACSLPVTDRTFSFEISNLLNLDCVEMSGRETANSPLNALKTLYNLGDRKRDTPDTRCSYHCLINKIGSEAYFP